VVLSVDDDLSVDPSVGLVSTGLTSTGGFIITGSTSGTAAAALAAAATSFSIVSTFFLIFYCPS